jgi:hypothetical protein
VGGGRSRKGWRREKGRERLIHVSEVQQRSLPQKTADRMIFKYSGDSSR